MTNDDSLAALRREYLSGGLSRSDLEADPVRQFRRWLDQAIELKLDDPTAMVLATAGEEGMPSQRIVLLKGLDEQGFVFYTNYASRKARELEANPCAGALFPWHRLDRQVRVNGVISRTSESVSRAYFASRPRDSQLAAWASAQSREIPSREHLMKALGEVRERFEGQDVPLPDNWGGYCLKPQEVEFWQGGEHRLHDRFRYRLTAAGEWRIDRLAP